MSILRAVIATLNMAAVHVRVKEGTKKSAQKILNKMGVDLSTAINLYLHQIILTKGIPFPLFTENGLTFQQEKEMLEAEKEAAQGVNITRTTTWEETKAHLDSLKRRGK